MNFIEELKWRGMIHDKMPGIEKHLENGKTTAYVGIDPTADSLHIGHLVSIMMLKHFQLAGHNPIVLLGGATGMIGDPSGKSEERNLLSEREIRHNELCVKTQLLKFLDFDKKENPAEILNNYDWTKKYKILDFLREIGKHITINYMLAKDSVKSRLDTGISFTEFTYQLIQAYDFFWLYENRNCTLQMGGSDQWGNITTGMDLIRRKSQGETFGLTCPLITKSDGGKFGKTEDGNIWLDPKKTSPYKFYQFWLNCSDEDSEKYIKIFTTLSKKEIEKTILEHKKSPHSRLLQKTLAKFLTITVHSEDDYNAAINASEILFGKGTLESLKKLPEDMFLSIFEGVPKFEISKNDLDQKTEIFSFLTETAKIFASKGELRRLVKDNGISVNKEKIKENFVFSEKTLLNEKYILIQKGKKNYFLIIVK